MNASLDSRLVTQARKFSSLQGLEPSLEVPPPLEVLAVAAHKEDLYPAEDDGDQQAQSEHRDETARAVESAEHVAQQVNTAGDDDAQAGGDATGAALARRPAPAVLVRTRDAGAERRSAELPRRSDGGGARPRSGSDRGDLQFRPVRA